MSLREAMLQVADKIEADEMPSSESSIALRKAIDQYFSDGDEVVLCVNQPVIDYDGSLNLG